MKLKQKYKISNSIESLNNKMQKIFYYSRQLAPKYDRERGSNECSTGREVCGEKGKYFSPLLLVPRKDDEFSSI